MLVIVSKVSYTQYNTNIHVGMSVLEQYSRESESVKGGDVDGVIDIAYTYLTWTLRGGVNRRL